jgi:predicted Ser/Thr protein kinase
MKAIKHLYSANTYEIKKKFCPSCINRLDAIIQGGCFKFNVQKKVGLNRIRYGCGRYKPMRTIIL